MHKNITINILKISVSLVQMLSQSSPVIIFLRHLSLQILASTGRKTISLVIFSFPKMSYY